VSVAGPSNLGSLSGAGGLSGTTVYFTPTTSWQFVELPLIFATTTTLSFSIFIPDDGNSYSFFADAAIVELASTYEGTFFDGNTADAGGVDYAWTGTANASTSTATKSVTFEQIAGAIPAGGTTNQVLTKISSNNYVTAWTTLPVASTTVAGITEYSTDAEAITGTSTTTAMTPASTKAALNDASNGYRLKEVVEYVAGGTFTKASYPGLRAVRVRLVGGGGAGGGSSAPAAGNHSKGGGGGGGGYAESFILAASLGTSETITIGAGGTGVSGANGNDGGASSFGTLVAANGGEGGNFAAASTIATSAVGLLGGLGTAGDILVAGGAGAHGTGNATLGTGGAGGSSALGGGGRSVYTGAGSGSTTGIAGQQYGGGGGGSASNASGAARLGGAGAAGIVIVEVYV
jgi:hypothetical protein